MLLLLRDREARVSSGVPVCNCLVLIQGKPEDQPFSSYIWVWLKVKQKGVRRFRSMFPLTRVPFWYRFFEPQPYERQGHRTRPWRCR